MAITVKATIKTTQQIVPFVVNTDPATDFAQTTPFLDFSKLCRWQYDDGSYKNYTSANLNANGYPNAVPSGAAHAKLVFSGLAPAWNQVFLLTWNSSDNLTVTSVNGPVLSGVSYSGGVGTAMVTMDANGGEIRFARSAGGSGSLDLTFVSLVPTATLSNGMTAQQMIDAGNYVHPDYAAFYRPQGKRMWAIRTMDWNNVNDFLDVVTTPVPLGYANWYRVPPEVIADLVNQANPVHVWVCLPVNCTQAFRRTFFAALRDNITTDTIVRVEDCNELWNSGFAQLRAMLGEGVTYYADNGVTGTFDSASAVLDASARTLTLTTGQGAAMAAAVSASGRVVSVGGQSYDVASVVGDVVNIASYETMRDSSGTYTARFGTYSMAGSWKAERLETIRQDCEFVWPVNSPQKYQTVIAGFQALFDAALFTTPQWLELEPSRPSPASRHDVYSEAAYFYTDGTGLGPTVTLFKDGSEAAAVTQYTSLIRSPRTNAAARRIELDIYAPNMPSEPYEGGNHIHSISMSLDCYVSATQSVTNGNTTLTVPSGQGALIRTGMQCVIPGQTVLVSSVSGDTVTLASAITVSTGTYSVTFRWTSEDARGLEEAWRDSTDAAVTLRAWVVEQVENYGCACQYQMHDVGDQFGYFGIYSGYDGTLDRYGEYMLTLYDALSPADFWTAP